MRIIVKLFANLRDKGEKEQVIELGLANNPKGVIEYLGIPLEDVAIIMINGRRVDLYANLKNNDTLSLFPPVGGG